MCKYEWILGPVCSNKTRVKIRGDTVVGAQKSIRWRFFAYATLR
ncbi:cysteine-rich KTR domain-containing protein [Aggregatilinea lenta]